MSVTFPTIAVDFIVLKVGKGSISFSYTGKALKRSIRFCIIPSMEGEKSRITEESEKRPWHILVILLISLMPATANTFLYSFVMLSTAKDWG